LRNQLTKSYEPTLFVSTLPKPHIPTRKASFVKELAKLTHRKIELIKISSPSENKKYASAQTNTTQKMTGKLNNDNGLQTRWTITPA